MGDCGNNNVKENWICPVLLGTKIKHGGKWISGKEFKYKILFSSINLSVSIMMNVCREPYWGAMPPGRNLTLTKVKFLSQPLSGNSCVSHNSLHLGWSSQTKAKSIVLQGPAVS